jgi:hypothetical protein
MGLMVLAAQFFNYAVKRDRSRRVESYLFDWCFQHGTAPDDWGLALSATDTSGAAIQLTGVVIQRPIAVVQVISKMFAMVLRAMGFMAGQRHRVIQCASPHKLGSGPCTILSTLNAFTPNPFINQ